MHCYNLLSKMHSLLMIEGYQINFELAEEGMAAVVGDS
jgi:hypothetical protein